MTEREAYETAERINEMEEHIPAFEDVVATVKRGTSSFAVQIEHLHYGESELADTPEHAMKIASHMAMEHI